jgi:assimilatory nitrate reductase catalytic subunit
VASIAGDGDIRITGDDDHPANHGRLCVKGSTLADTLPGTGRLLQPQYCGTPLSWDNALDRVAETIQRVLRESGPEAIACYLSGQLLTEDYYVANKLMKGFIGSANVDTNSRLCMASAVAAHRRAFGADLVPCSYTDLEEAKLVVMVGSNAAWTHPVVYQRIAESRRNCPQKRIVVIDPRATATCDIADLHLPIAPGSDAFLFAGLLQWLVKHKAVDNAYIEAHCEGFDATLASSGQCDLATVAAHTQLAPDVLVQFYQWFAETDQTVTVFSQGVNQSASGTDKCNAIINCHLATGRIGKPGSGPFSITGQPNAMGGREVGGLANQLAAHMDFTSEDIDRVQRFWDAPAMALAPGLKAVDMFEAAATGKIRVLWIMATNPAVSLPNSARVREALANCEFVIVSDCVADTDTTALADLLLPAMAWGEKDGTVTNSERCISRQRRFFSAPGEARPDWWMVTQVAHRLGFGRQFSYTSAADIFVEHAALSAFENNGIRDFDIGPLAQLTAAEYADLAPVCWPISPKSSRPQLLADGIFFTPSGKARFVALTPQAARSDYWHADALLLNSGRLRDQWHSMTRTGGVPKLMRHRDFFSIGINPGDALQRGLQAGDLVELSNPLGAVRGVLQADPELPPGQLFAPIHWSDQFSGQAVISQIFAAITDPVSGQPQSKFAWVSLTPIATSGWAFVLTREPLDIGEAAYWSRITVTGGYLTLLAIEQNKTLLDSLTTLLQRSDLGLISYEDKTMQDFRCLGVAQAVPDKSTDGTKVYREASLEYAIYAHAQNSQLPQRDWLASLFSKELPLPASAILAARESSDEDAGQLICTCWEVAEGQINKAIAGGACSVEMLGQRLRCGTECGSCVPELKRLLARTAKVEAA